jgi:hypothetical protein
MELDHGTVIVFHMKWLAFWLDRARVLASHGRVADTPQFRPASSTLAAGGVPEIPSDGCYFGAAVPRIFVGEISPYGG